MKRLIFGFAVMTLAAASAASTTPTIKHDKFVDSYFEFDHGTYIPTKNNVEDEGKWFQVADSGECNAAQIRACRIRVTYTHVSGSTLLPNTMINAFSTSPSTAYVLSAVAVQIRNKN